MKLYVTSITLSSDDLFILNAKYCNTQYFIIYVLSCLLAPQFIILLTLHLSCYQYNSFIDNTII